MQGTNWVKVSERLPDEGKAVIVTFGRAIQNITYELIHCDNHNELRWFPHNNCELPDAHLEAFDYWMYIKDIPLPPMPEGE